MVIFFGKVFPLPTLSFDLLAYKKFILLERSCDEEYIEHQKVLSQQLVICERLEIEKKNKVILNGALVLNYGLYNFANVDERTIWRERYHLFFYSFALFKKLVSRMHGSGQI